MTRSDWKRVARVAIMSYTGSKELLPELNDEPMTDRVIAACKAAVDEYLTIIDTQY